MPVDVVGSWRALFTNNDSVPWMMSRRTVTYQPARRLKIHVYTEQLIHKYYYGTAHLQCSVFVCEILYIDILRRVFVNSPYRSMQQLRDFP